MNESNVENEKGLDWKYVVELILIVLGWVVAGIILRVW